MAIREGLVSATELVLLLLLAQIDACHPSVFEQPPHNGEARRNARVVLWNSTSCSSTPECAQRFRFGLEAETTARTCRTDALHCDHVFDAWCPNMYRDAFWHRIVDCLLPSYGVVDRFAKTLQASESYNSSNATDVARMRVCIVLFSSPPHRESYDATVVAFLPKRWREPTAFANLVLWDPTPPHNSSRHTNHQLDTTFETWPHDTSASTDTSNASITTNARADATERANCIQLSSSARISSWIPPAVNFKQRGCDRIEQDNLNYMMTALHTNNDKSSHVDSIQPISWQTRAGSSKRAPSSSILKVVWIQRSEKDERNFQQFDDLLERFHRRFPHALVYVFGGDENGTFHCAPV